MHSGEKVHYPALDSLRGLAAVAVVLSHMYLALHGTQWGLSLAPLFDRTPLQLFVNGEGAVILFFVLSGFVLTLVADVSTAANAASYFVRRIARIWLPYVCALVAFVVASHFVRGMTNGQYKVFDGIWNTPFQIRTFLVHLSLVGSLDQTQYMGASWSLVHEMRISLIFPLVLFFLRGSRWYVTAAVAMTFLYGGRWLGLHFGFDQFSTSPLNTLYYFGMFALGILAAQNREMIRRIADSATKGSHIALAAIALVLYEGNLVWFNSGLIPPVPIAEIMGALLLVVIGIGHQKDGLLSGRIFVWLGKISYSLYLWHPLLILILYRTLNNVVGPVTISVFLLVGSLILAQVSHAFIELPAIALGKAISRRLRQRKHGFLSGSSKSAV